MLRLRILEKEGKWLVQLSFIDICDNLGIFIGDGTEQMNQLTSTKWISKKHIRKVIRNVGAVSAASLILAGCVTNPYTGEREASNTAKGAGIGAALGLNIGTGIGIEIRELLQDQVLRLLAIDAMHSNPLDAIGHRIPS